MDQATRVLIEARAAAYDAEARGAEQRGHERAERYYLGLAAGLREALRLTYDMGRSEASHA